MQPLLIRRRGFFMGAGVATRRLSLTYPQGLIKEPVIYKVAKEYRLVPHIRRAPLHVCDFCFDRLGVDYDSGTLQRCVTRKRIEPGPPTMWRYRDLLPIAAEEPVGTHCGMTPLIRAKHLAEALGA